MKPKILQLAFLNIFFLMSCQESTLQNTNTPDGDNQSSTSKNSPLILDFTSNQAELSLNIQTSSESTLNLSSSATKIPLSSSVSQISYTPKPSSSNPNVSSSFQLSSSTLITGLCQGLDLWHSISWAETDNKINYIDSQYMAAWSCDGTFSCVFEPGDPQSAWIKEFDCE